MPRYKEKEKLRREQEILHQAKLLLSERGYAQLNMDDLAERVGISKPTLYQHFKSKEDLVVRVVIDSYSMMGERLQELDGKPPSERLKKMFQWILVSRYQQDSTLTTVDPDVMWTVIRNHPALIENRQKAMEHITKWIEEAKAAGELRAELPTPIIVRSFFCMQLIFKDPSNFMNQYVQSREDLEQAAATVADILFSGIAVHKDTNG